MSKEKTSGELLTEYIATLDSIANANSPELTQILKKCLELENEIKSLMDAGRVALVNPKENEHTKVTPISEDKLPELPFSQSLAEATGQSQQAIDKAFNSAHWNFCVKTIDNTQPCNCLPPYARPQPKEVE